MKRRRPNLRGRCQQCKREDQPLDRFKKKYLCPECMNPDEKLRIEDYAGRRSSSLADFEEQRDAPIRLTKAERRGLGT